MLQRARPSRGRRGVWGLGWEAPCLSGFYKLLGQQERRICKYTSYSKFCYYKFIHGPSRVRRQKSDPGPTESLRRMKNSTLSLGDPSPASGAGVGSGRAAGGERRPERSSQVLNSGRGPPKPPPATAPPPGPVGPAGCGPGAGRPCGRGAGRGGHVGSATGWAGRRWPGQRLPRTQVLSSCCCVLGTATLLCSLHPPNGVAPTAAQGREQILSKTPNLRCPPRDKRKPRGDGFDSKGGGGVHDGGGLGERREARTVAQQRADRGSLLGARRGLVSAAFMLRAAP